MPAPTMIDRVCPCITGDGRITEGHAALISREHKRVLSSKGSTFNLRQRVFQRIKLLLRSCFNA